MTECLAGGHPVPVTIVEAAGDTIRVPFLRPFLTTLFLILCPTLRPLSLPARKESAGDKGHTLQPDVFANLVSDSFVETLVDRHFLLDICPRHLNISYALLHGGTELIANPDRVQRVRQRATASAWPMSLPCP